MISERDIYASANLLIQDHGKDAAVFAATQADACLERGDPAGKPTWHQVVKAIEELQTAPPKAPGHLH